MGEGVREGGRGGGHLKRGGEGEVGRGGEGVR